MFPLPAEGAAPLPFFVYGTLRTGQPNHFRLERAVLWRRAALWRGVVLWNLGPYPMATRGQGTVHGELIAVPEEGFAAILRALDRLEGVHFQHPERPGGLFHRERVRVECEGETVPAWAYLGREDLAQRGVLVPGGDWTRRALPIAEEK